MVSVLIPVLNEARNLADCIQSVAWADDVVVVDSGSSDGSVQIAEATGARVVQFKWDGRFPKKKNWALQNVDWRNEWVLILDADERITAQLADEIRAELRHPRADGYFLNRRFIFLDRWIRHCGYYPSWNLRLFRHALGRYEKLHDGDTGSGDNEVHEHIALNGTTSQLKNDMVHFAYPDIATWIEKHNRYSNWEARIEIEGNGAAAGQGVGREAAARRRLRTWSRSLPFRPTLRFFYSYFLRRGFLDGYAGYVFCWLLASYEMMSVFKAHELRRRKAKAGADRWV